MTGPNREQVTDLPPSAKLVFTVLEREQKLTQKDIVEESRLSPRTVRYALKRLESIGVVEEEIYFADARQRLYHVTETESIASE
ncbi:helix-turn-helix domain-containing protein [Halomontanus rarus]|uniref:MarR family transcriptional regulator n=1 Tax=Halomontanus rarus TaxID=3034020 RepID=UPI00293BB721|nr:helix-turn-helix domain-containing protein [Halovivax sp. KZCA124]